MFAPSRVRTWLYRFAIERGYLDAILNDYIVRPFVWLFLRFDRLERRWVALLAGTPAEDNSPPLESRTESIERIERREGVEQPS